MFMNPGPAISTDEIISFPSITSLSTVLSIESPEPVSNLGRFFSSIYSPITSEEMIISTHTGYHGLGSFLSSKGLAK